MCQLSLNAFFFAVFFCRYVGEVHVIRLTPSPLSPSLPLAFTALSSVTITKYVFLFVFLCVFPCLFFGLTVGYVVFCFPFLLSLVPHFLCFLPHFFLLCIPFFPLVSHFLVFVRPVFLFRFLFSCFVFTDENGTVHCGVRRRGRRG